MEYFITRRYNYTANTGGFWSEQERFKDLRQKLDWRDLAVAVVQRRRQKTRGMSIDSAEVNDTISAAYQRTNINKNNNKNKHE